MSTPEPQLSDNLRERKKAQTRNTIQKEALRLFLSRGYDATTVGEIAAAAGVSHMTFFRYFPTKEDVVLSDDYDPLLAESIESRPPGEPPLERIQHALREGLARIYATDRDALLARTQLILSAAPLRARMWEQQVATERLIAHALAAADDDRDTLRSRVIASACLGAITSAVTFWAESDGGEELPELIDHALDTLRSELCGTDE